MSVYVQGCLVQYHRISPLSIISSVAITYLLCFWRPMQDWILSLCAVRHKTLLFFPSVQQHAFWFLCLVMINNTIDYLVLLAITFLLVIVFILLISLYVFLISWYWFPYKARRWQNNPNKNKKINVVFPSFSYSHFSLVTTNEICETLDRKRVFIFLIFDSFSFSKRIIRTLYSFLFISTLSSHCASTFSVLSEPARVSPTNVTTVFVMFALCFFSPLLRRRYNWE